MAEVSLKDYVLRGMVGHWDKGVKHADSFTAGIADLSGYIPVRGNVFVELKALDAWPAKASTRVVFELDDLQRDFLWKRRGWLLCRVGREYLLFDRYAIIDAVDRPWSTRELLMNHVYKVWRNSIDWKEFTKCLKSKN
jgi:hypothetical protein